MNPSPLTYAGTWQREFHEAERVGSVFVMSRSVEQKRPSPETDRRRLTCQDVTSVSLDV